MREPVFFKGKYFRSLTLLLLTIFLGEIIVAQDSLKSKEDYFNLYGKGAADSFENRNPYYIVKGTKVLRTKPKIVRQLDDNTAIVELNSVQELNSLRNFALVKKANDEWKLSPPVSRIKFSDTKIQDFILSGTEFDSLLLAIQQVKPSINIIQSSPISRSIIIRCSAEILKYNLVENKFLTFVDIRIKPHTEITILGYDRSVSGINAVDYEMPGADGHDIVVGVKEQRMDEFDIDLFKRVVPSSIGAANTSNHATVISSIIGGAGNSFYDGRGIAHSAKFFSSNFDNLFPDDSGTLNSAKVTVQNHSYGTVIQQFYGAEAAAYDAQSWYDDRLVHVFSAGNSGTGSASEGPYANLPGFANLTGNFKMAKNVLTIAAIDSTDEIPDLNSAGPVYDGRLAPQLTAPGPNGTSDAAAFVSGTIAVMQQVYADSNAGQMPNAGLIKAALFNSVEDIYTAGPDYKSGFGLLNSFDAIQTFQQKRIEKGSVSNQQIWTKTISVPPNAASFKVTVSWTDSFATINNFRALINDLDLDVLDISSGQTYQPWILNTAPFVDSLSKPATRARDSLNTAEQVSIVLPHAGDYQIRVRGFSVQSKLQNFAVAWGVDTLHTFRFTSPQHASDVILDGIHDLKIKWQSFIADSNETGNLFISYDRGNTWNLVQFAIKLNRHQTHSEIKDTASTALFKMETGFGNFFSKEFVISTTLQPQLDFVCSDSFGISWHPHVYANTYRVFTLADSAYLKPIVTVSDTFLVLNRSQYPGTVIAVEPILTNGLAACRSIAFEITKQGVKCFYRTFYHNMQDENRLELVLELSSPAMTDSVFFEQVDETGRSIKFYGGLDVDIASVYRFYITETPAGNSYWRAIIKLKSGQVLTTNILKILSTGKKFIRFYPNPVSRNESLNFLLKQGIPYSSKLQFFDVTGRLLRSYQEMPNSINLSTLQAGLIIYKLLSSDNQVLETGKIVVK